MDEFLTSLQAQKQKILATLDPKILEELTHLDALIAIHTAKVTPDDGGDRPPTPPPVG